MFENHVITTFLFTITEMHKRQTTKYNYTHSQCTAVTNVPVSLLVWKGPYMSTCKELPIHFLSPFPSYFTGYLTTVFQENTGNVWNESWHTAYNLSVFHNRNIFFIQFAFFQFHRQGFFDRWHPDTLVDMMPGYNAVFYKWSFWAVFCAYHHVVWVSLAQVDKLCQNINE